ncbi:MAG: ATP-binding protein, partial [Myxococcales bacterium]
VTIAPDLPGLEADPMLLRRVLDNLLDNAHKYTPEPDRPVRLEARRDPGGVAFLVHDRGAGIAASDLPHLFTPFFRGDRSRNRGTGGVGLGLALARRIVEAHGGRIELKSTPGQGTVATVIVPAAAPSPA